MIGLPNLLTILRIAFVPFTAYACYGQTPHWWGIATFLFILACITDYADGYMARRYNSVSYLGAYLDPLADKLLVVIMLFTLGNLTVIQGINIIPTLIIVTREYILAGFRSPFHATVVRTTYLAKGKTFFEMTAIGILTGTGFISNPLKPAVLLIGFIALWTAAALATLTGITYLYNFFKVIGKQNNAL